MNIKSSWILTSRDNAEKGKEEKKDATLFKVKSLLDAVKAKCNKIEPEPFHSMKEQIIPAKKNGVGLFTNIIQKSHSNGASIILYEPVNRALSPTFLSMVGKNNNGGKPLPVKDIFLPLNCPESIQTKHLLQIAWMVTHFHLKKSWICKAVDHLITTPISIMVFTLSNSLTTDLLGMKTEKVFQRWDAKQKKHIQVKCTDTVLSYNASMSRPDLVLI